MRYINEYVTNHTFGFGNSTKMPGGDMPFLQV